MSLRAHRALGRTGFLILVYGLISCGADPQRSLQPQSDAIFVGYDDGCWPISSECQDRALTGGEWNAAYNAIGLIEGTDAMCFDIRDKAMDDLLLDKIRFWTTGPSGYDPANYYGDRHNVPGVTHVTGVGFATTDDLIETLAHETAHALGYNHDDMNGRCGISLA